jgi:hypothetical protein
MTDPLRFPVLLEALSNGKWRATAITVSMAALAATREDALDGVLEAIRRKIKRINAEHAEDPTYSMLNGLMVMYHLLHDDKPRFFHNWVAAMVAQGAGTTLPPYEASIVLLSLPEAKPTTPA